MPVRRRMLRMCVLRVDGEMLRSRQMSASCCLWASMAAMSACCGVSPSPRNISRQTSRSSGTPPSPTTGSPPGWGHGRTSCPGSHFCQTRPHSPQQTKDSTAKVRKSRLTAVPCVRQCARAPWVIIPSRMPQSSSPAPQHRWSCRPCCLPDSRHSSVRLHTASSIWETCRLCRDRAGDSLWKSGHVV